MNTINWICQSDVLGNDCEPFGLLVGSCNDVQDTSAAAARKDQDSKRGCGSQRCHPQLRSAVLRVSRWLRIKF